LLDGREIVTYAMAKDSPGFGYNHCRQVSESEKKSSPADGRGKVRVQPRRQQVRGL